MKIAITGHSKGIGKSIADVFEKHSYDLTGFSRTNGFDISDNITRSNIVKLSEDADIFVNNAYHPIGQLDLLKQVSDRWAGTDKIIINISSKITYYTGPGADKFSEYILAKQKQNEFIKNRITTANPRILNVIPGFVDTDMTKGFSNLKTNPDKIAEMIYALLEFKEHLYIQEIVLDVPNLHWKDIIVSSLISV